MCDKICKKCVTKYETAWPCVFNPLLSGPTSKASEKVLNLYSKASKYLAKCVTKYETAWPCVFNPLLSAPTSMASQKVSNHSRASKYM